MSKFSSLFGCSNTSQQVLKILGFPENYSLRNILLNHKEHQAQEQHEDVRFEDFRPVAI